MVKIAVCGNNQGSKEGIHDLITAYAKQCGIICQMELFDTGEDFVKLNDRMLSYRVVFLIIQDFEGIAIAQKIREFDRNIILVFVADNDTFVQEGYKVDAIRYLIRGEKDFETELCECMQAIFKRLHYVLKKKVFSFSEGERELSIDRILYVESSLHRLIFHVVEEGEQSYSLYGTLNQMEKELPEHDFVRVHQSFLVNMKHIRSMNGRMLVLSNNEELRIVKARLRNVRERYDQYKEMIKG